MLPSQKLSNSKDWALCDRSSMKNKIQSYKDDNLITLLIFFVANFKKEEDAVWHN